VNSGALWTFHVSRPDTGSNLQLRLERAGAEPSEFTLTQDCGLWLGSGPGTFRASGLADITFIEDPVEPGVVWLRNRFFAAGRRPPDVAAPAVYLPMLVRSRLVTGH
jgi:hypothetical protein